MVPDRSWSSLRTVAEPAQAPNAQGFRRFASRIARAPVPLRPPPAGAGGGDTSVGVMVPQAAEQQEQHEQ